jgi:hypothetical protein
MATFPVYLDVPRYLNNAAHGLEVNSLIGGNSTLANGYTAGATSLVLPSVTSFVAGPAWILDGLTSEIVQITTVTANTKTLTLASPGLLADHSAGASISQASVTNTGCLADIIVQASREVDNICKQGADGVLDRSLYAVSRTEIYDAPYGYAEFTVDNALAIHSYHFPVQSVSTISVQAGGMNPLNINTQFMYLANGARTIKVPFAQMTSPVSIYRIQLPFSRNQETAVTLTYTGGPITGTTLDSVPQDIQRACMSLVNDILSVRKNPVGAMSIKRGDENYSFTERGDTSGKTLLRRDAEMRLQSWTRVM